MDEVLAAHLRDLAARAEDQSLVTCSQFLTPLEQQELLQMHLPGLYLWGGTKGAERRLAFFLPFYQTPETLETEQYLTAIHVRTPFQQLTHRDYLGALMNLGIRRECLGDLYVSGEEGWFFTLPSVEKHLLLSLDKIGRGGARTEKVSPSAVPAPEQEMKPVEFTVKSLRLDAVAGGLFGISRSAMQDAIEGGLVTLNYAPCVRCDAAVGEGDLISLRGKGKGKILTVGGQSKKDRTFLTCGLFQ